MVSSGTGLCNRSASRAKIAASISGVRPYPVNIATGTISPFERSRIALSTSRPDRPPLFTRITSTRAARRSGPIDASASRTVDGASARTLAATVVDVVFQSSPHDGYVLLVDDEPEIRTTVTRFLGRRWFRDAEPTISLAVSSCSHRLRLLQREAPHRVVRDARGPSSRPRQRTR